MSIILRRFLSVVDEFFFSRWECWGIYFWVHIIIHGLLMGAKATTRVEMNQMVDQ